MSLNIKVTVKFLLTVEVFFLSTFNSSTGSFCHKHLLIFLEKKIAHHSRNFFMLFIWQFNVTQNFLAILSLVLISTIVKKQQQLNNSGSHWGTRWFIYILIIFVNIRGTETDINFRPRCNSEDWRLTVKTNRGSRFPSRETVRSTRARKTLYEDGLVQ